MSTETWQVLDAIGGPCCTDAVTQAQAHQIARASGVAAAAAVPITDPVDAFTF